MPTPERVEKIERVVARRQRGLVVFEDIHDPHNAEAVLRTCDAFGFQRACFVFDKEKPFDPRAVGKASSASANKWLDFQVFGSIDACVAELRRCGFEIVATVVDPAAESLFDARFQAQDVAIMLGNEHRGLSERAVALADRRVTVPMAGMVRSLNVSVTAGLVLYEITRQRRRRGIERYRLPGAEQQRLLAALLAR
ncbi:MAG: RNA methyltransferase [Dehalococcoidia bacterium]